MKFRFLMSHGRKNSMRAKVIGKKWIYLEREEQIPHRGCESSQKARVASKYASFYGLGNFIG